MLKGRGQNAVQTGDGSDVNGTYARPSVLHDEVH